MANSALQYATGDRRIDQILCGVVGVFEAAFPGRMRAYYLLGSYSNGSAVPTSDLDMGLLLADGYRDGGEEDRAVRLCQDCEAISGMLLELWVMSEERLAQPDRFGTALQLRFGSQLLYGEDVRGRLVVQADDRYVRWAMHVPVYGLLGERGQSATLTSPLDYPDPTGEFYGYDQLALAGAGGADRPGTKLLVAIVGRIAAALVALATGRYVGSKRESVALYRSYVADEWADLVEQVYTLCRNQWGYLVPSDPADRALLRDLCRRALAFENHFLLIYKTYLLALLQVPERAQRLSALETLRQVVYPTPDVLAAVQALVSDGDAALARAAEETLQVLAGVHRPRGRRRAGRR